MGDLVAASDSISPLVAVLWVFYPMAALVLVELILRAINPDDDDDDTNGGKGVRIMQPQPVPVPSGAWLKGINTYIISVEYFYLVKCHKQSLFHF